MSYPRAFLFSFVLPLCRPLRVGAFVFDALVLPTTLRPSTTHTFSTRLAAATTPLVSAFGIVWLIDVVCLVTGVRFVIRGRQGAPRGRLVLTRLCWGSDSYSLVLPERVVPCCWRPHRLVPRVLLFWKSKVDTCCAGVLSGLRRSSGFNFNGVTA